MCCTWVQVLGQEEVQWRPRKGDGPAEIGLEGNIDKWLDRLRCSRETLGELVELAH